MSMAGGPGGGGDPGNSGGGSSGGRGGGASGRGGGGYGGAVGAGVDASSRGGRSSGRGGGGYSGAVGAGVDASSRGNAGGPGGGSDPGNQPASSPSSRADSRSDTRAGSRTVGAQNEASSARGTMDSFSSIADGAIANFGDVSAYGGALGNAAQAAAESYGGAMGNAGQAASMTRDQHTTSLSRAGVPESVQRSASSGLLGSAMSLGLGILGGPAGAVAGTAVDTGLAAKDAADTLGGINESFGTSLDASFGHSVGQQAKGSLASFAGGMVGGQIGSTVGASLAGMPGAMAVGSLASATLGNFARDSALSSEPGAPSATPSGASGGGLLASGMPSQNAQPAPAAVASPNFEVADFDGYASYAESFFA